MPDYGTDKLSLQNTTGAILSASGDPLLSTNSDSSQAVVFGAIATREIQTAIANGAFDSQPPLPDEIIDEETNPIAYWSVEDSSGGTISAKSVVEPTNPSGFTIGITVPDATPSGLSWSLSTFFPITGNSAEVLALDPIVYLDAEIVSGTPNIDIVLAMEFADVDFAAVGGTAFGTATYDSLIAAGISAAEKSVSTDTVIAPPEAAFGKITITTTTIDTVSTTGTAIVYVREAMVRRGFSFIPISDNVASGRPAAFISHSGGNLDIVSGSRVLDGSGNVRLTASTGGGTAATLDLVNATNSDAPISTYPSAMLTMTGKGTSPGLIFSSTESAGDVNLYRNTADVWKTDDSLIVDTDLTVGGSATITGSLTVGGNSVDGIPAGVVQSYLGGTSAVPSGWVLANGASLSTATYPALFAVLAYRFGGSGANFSVPNLNNGHILVGSTSTPGTAFMTGSDDGWLNASWDHTHSTNPASTNSSTAVAISGGQLFQVTGSNTSGHRHSTDIAATTSSSDGPSGVRRIRVNYIIKT